MNAQFTSGQTQRERESARKSPLSHSHTHTHTHSLSLSLSLSFLSLTHTLSLSLSHTHSLSLHGSCLQVPSSCCLWCTHTLATPHGREKLAGDAGQHQRGPAAHGHKWHKVIAAAAGRVSAALCVHVCALHGVSRILNKNHTLTHSHTHTHTHTNTHAHTHARTCYAQCKWG
jgi:hypothetical protein